MANQDERLAALEEKAIQQQAASITLVGMVKEIHDQVREHTTVLRSLQAQSTITEMRLNAMDARLGVVEVRLNAMEAAIGAGFSQLIKTLDERLPPAKE